MLYPDVPNGVNLNDYQRLLRVKRKHAAAEMIVNPDMQHITTILDRTIICLHHNKKNMSKHYPKASFNSFKIRARKVQTFKL